MDTNLHLRCRIYHSYRRQLCRQTHCQTAAGDKPSPARNGVSTGRSLFWSDSSRVGATLDEPAPPQCANPVPANMGCEPDSWAKSGWCVTPLANADNGHTPSSQFFKRSRRVHEKADNCCTSLHPIVHELRSHESTLDWDEDDDRLGAAVKFQASFLPAGRAPSQATYR